MWPAWTERTATSMASRDLYTGRVPNTLLQTGEKKISKQTYNCLDECI